MKLVGLKPLFAHYLINGLKPVATDPCKSPGQLTGILFFYQLPPALDGAHNILQCWLKPTLIKLKSFLVYYLIHGLKPVATDPCKSTGQLTGILFFYQLPPALGAHII
jgi:hypothetical protein